MDYLVLYVWGGVAILMIILEMALSGVMQIWFAIGAICAAVIEWLSPGSYWLELLAFFGVSGVLVLLGSFLLQKDSSNNPGPNPVYSILNKTAVVTKEIDPSTGEGQISINGDKWSAKVRGNEVIPENAKVKVRDIRQTVQSKYKKNKDLSTDLVKYFEDELNKVTKNANKTLEEMFAKKEKNLLSF